MQLNRNQIPAISRTIVKALVDSGDIEVTTTREVAIDLESVLNSYLSAEAEISDEARDLVQQRGLPQGEFGRIKALCAERRGIKVGEDALDYLLDQLLQMLMHSSHVEEIFGDDNVLRRNMRPALRSGETKNAEIDSEIRAKLRHVKEGSRLWEIEYERMKDDIKRRRG